jgi:hypothetical protein
MLHYQRALSSTVTTSVPSTSPLTLFSTSIHPCPAHPNDLPVHRYLHKGSAHFGVFGSLVQFQHSSWLEFQLWRGVLECVL